MGLTICNGYSSAVTVAIGYLNLDHCANAGRWIKEGWWNIAPGQCVRVYGGSQKTSIEIGSIMLVLKMEPFIGQVIIVPIFLTKHSTSVGIILPVMRHVIDC